MNQKQIKLVLTMHISLWGETVNLRFDKLKLCAFKSTPTQSILSAASRPTDISTTNRITNILNKIRQPAVTAKSINGINQTSFCAIRKLHLK